MTSLGNQESGYRAAYYQKNPDEKLLCELCPRACQLGQAQRGFCGVRTHRDGILWAENYARVSGLALDPIEKKPLYHFLPGKPILSVGTVGCNLACEFCQNWHISRDFNAETKKLGPEEVAEMAVRAHREYGSVGVAYTYSEPGVWFEFLKDTMPLIRKAGLVNVLVTNAFLNPDPWQELLKWTDAANIDLKGFEPNYYRKLCHGLLEPVLENIKEAAGKIHLELTTLIIPGENDRPEEIRAMAKWIGEIDQRIPLHLSRYFPNYKMKAPPTPEATMRQAREIAGEFLDYVYVGNCGWENDTRCPECGEILIEREGFQSRVIDHEKCRGCGRKTDYAL